MFSSTKVLWAAAIVAGLVACSSAADNGTGSSSSGGSSGTSGGGSSSGRPSGSSGSTSGSTTSGGETSSGVPTGDARQDAIRARCEKGKECGQIGDATVEQCVTVFQDNQDPTEFLACMAQQSCADHNAPSSQYEGISLAAENCSDYIDVGGGSSGAGSPTCSQRTCQTGGDCPIECAGACTDKGSGKTCGYGP